MRPREYLTRAEIDCLIKAAKGNRHGLRDSTMILVGYSHGLRVSELIGLQWSDVSFEDATLHIRRAKGGNSADVTMLRYSAGLRAIAAIL